MIRKLQWLFVQLSENWRFVISNQKKVEKMMKEKKGTTRPSNCHIGDRWLERGSYKELMIEDNKSWHFKENTNKF